MATTTDTSQQYLTFDVAEETYGIEVRLIREILEMQPITRVPRTAEYLLGVMNVRGKAVPVVDLRRKFGLDTREQTVDSAIIVLEVSDSGADTLIGLLVDNVDEVLELGPESVEPAPLTGTTVDAQLLSGMTKQDDQFVLLLNTEMLFATDDQETAQVGPDDSDLGAKGAGGRRATDN